MEFSAIGDSLPDPPGAGHVGDVADRSSETVTRNSMRKIRPNLGMPRNGRDFSLVIAPTAFGVFGMPSLVFGLFPVLLKPAMPGIAVLISGVLGFVVTWSTFPAQTLVGRIGPYRGLRSPSHVERREPPSGPSHLRPIHGVGLYSAVLMGSIRFRNDVRAAFR